MSIAPRFSRTFNKIIYILEPKPHVAGLGRWGSTQSTQKNKRLWFHDMCNYDNCYTSMFSIIIFKTNSGSPPNPKSPQPDTIDNYNKKHDELLITPVHYIQE